ncbi:hypothetical protein MC885_001413, partial [Smutsia gigantea]
VVCIRSTWNALSPKLSCDTRPLIVKTLSELFSLVPSLTVNTAEYEDPVVANAAYKSLSHFSAGEHTILHLPEQIRPEIQIPDGLDEEEDDEGDEKDVDLSIPGSCYLRLLSLTAPSVLPALEEFFTSLVKQEMVHIQLSEWHRAIFLPQAWLAYMSRAYHAILQGRMGELELQLKHGKEEPGEVQYKKSTAWLWVRDMLTDEITKAAANDVSGQQMNLLLMKSLDALENCCFDTSLEYKYRLIMVPPCSVVGTVESGLQHFSPCRDRAGVPGLFTAPPTLPLWIQCEHGLLAPALITGCILGVGLVLSLMSHSSQMESRVHVAASLQKLSLYLDDSGSQSRTFQEVLAYTLSCVCISAFSAGIIEAAEAEDIMNKLRLLVENHQQIFLSLSECVTGFSLSPTIALYL